MAGVSCTTQTGGLSQIAGVARGAKRQRSRPDDLLLQVLDGGVGVGELGEQPLTGLPLLARRPLLDVDLGRFQICFPGEQHG